MEVTFWGVRGSIPAPGPGTIRYGGNTVCVSVRTEAGGLLVLDCGTGARNLGIALLGDGPDDRFRAGRGRAAILLSHTHWDHIQGFPFFGPLYVAGNAFTIHGSAQSSPLLERILEGQMAPQYFPVQTLKNMGAEIDVAALSPDGPTEILGCRVTTVVNPHGRTSALAFRIEEAGRTLVYASDADYGPEGPSRAALDLYRGADLLIHDSTYTPEDRLRQAGRGLSSVSEAVNAAVQCRARKLALFHYDQDYSDADLDLLVERGQREIDAAGTSLELVASTEGLTLRV